MGFETLSKLLLYGIYLKPVYTKATHYPNCMQNLPTALVAPSTPRLSVTDLAKIGKSGPHLHDSDLGREKTRNLQEQVVPEQVVHQVLVDLVVALLLVRLVDLVELQNLSREITLLMFFLNCKIVNCGKEMNV